MPTLTVIIGSTRPGRASLPIAAWFEQFARKHSGFDVEVADLAEINLPMFDEPNHPALRKYTHQHTIDWSKLIERSDAIAIVTPEYNHGYPAVLKNAIDYLHSEWQYKPVGFVSYGGVAAGTRAVQQLKQVVTTLRMTPVLDGVNIPFHAELIDGDQMQATEIQEKAATAMLDELLRVEKSTRPLRKA